MAFYSDKEEEADCSFMNSCERLHDFGDCILRDFLDFPLCSLGIQSDRVYPSCLTHKSDSDLWDFQSFETSQALDCGCPFKGKTDDAVSGDSFETLQSEDYRCSNNKIGDVSSEKFSKYISDEPLPTESNCQDSVLSLYEMSIPDDLHSLAMNINTTDLLTYLEGAGSACSAGNKSTTLVSASDCFNGMTNISEHIEESCGFEEGHSGGLETEKLLFMNSYDILTSDTLTSDTLTSDTEADVTPCSEAVCSRIKTFEQSGAFVAHGDCPVDSSSVTFEVEINKPVEKVYNKTGSIVNSNENISARPSAVSKVLKLSDTSSFQISASNGHMENVKQINNLRELSFLHSSSKSTFNTCWLNSNNVHLLEEVKEMPDMRTTTDSLTRNMPQQLQLPFSTDMNVDAHSSSSKHFCIPTAMPLPSTDSMISDDFVTKIPNKASLSSVNKTDSSILKLASKNKCSLKVGMKGRFVSVSAEKVNKLMVRDLLSMSGNRREVSIQDSTEEYRKNISDILQQKQKRLMKIV